MESFILFQTIQWNISNTFSFICDWNISLHANLLLEVADIVSPWNDFDKYWNLVEALIETKKIIKTFRIWFW